MVRPGRFAPSCARIGGDGIVARYAAGAIADRGDHVQILAAGASAAAVRYGLPLISRTSSKKPRLVGVLIAQFTGTFW